MNETTRRIMQQMNSTRIVEGPTGPKGEKGDKGSDGTNGTGVLVYPTLSALQTAFPSGTNIPVWITEENSWYYWGGEIIPPEEPAEDTTAPTVTASPNGGSFSSTQSVTLSANETATIYYTTDGSAPTISSSVYSAPISISATSALKFFGKDTAGNSSSVQTASFTITVSDTTAPVVTASPAAGTFSSAQSVTLSANESATIYYTLDGSTPTTSSTTYSTPISVSATTTLKYFGKDTANNSSAVQTAVYTISTTAYVSSGLTHHWDNLTSQVTATDDGTYIPKTGDFTLCAVFKYKAYMNIISMFNLGGNSQYRIWIEDFSGWRITGTFYTGSSTDVRSTTDPNTLSPTSYMSIAVVRQGTSLKLYFNNAQQASTTLTGTMTTPDSTTVKIGDVSSDVKAIYLYNRALDTTELTQNYNNL